MKIRRYAHKYAVALLGNRFGARVLIALPLFGMSTSICPVNYRTPCQERAMAQTASRTERTEARLRPDQKARIEYAASLRGVSVSDFIVQHAEEAAIRTIQQHESWTLDAQDRDFFIEALLNPPEPSPRLIETAERYRLWKQER
jgi:uncharacterized protein (DUF1778 family)